MLADKDEFNREVISKVRLCEPKNVLFGHARCAQVVPITDRICLRMLFCVSTALSVTIYGNKVNKVIHSSYFALFGANCVSTKPRKKEVRFYWRKRGLVGFWWILFK